VLVAGHLSRSPSKVTAHPPSVSPVRRGVLHVSARLRLEGIRMSDRQVLVVLTSVTFGVLVMLGMIRYVGAAIEWQARGCEPAILLPALYGEPDPFRVCAR
jgi:hypothetical protein